MDDYVAVKTFTIDEAIETIGFGRYQWILLVIVGLSWVADAMEMMLLSFLGPVLKCQWDLDPKEESLLTSVVFVGMMIGNNFWGYVADRYGRKKGVVYCCVFIALFGVISAFSTNIAMLSGMRFFVGFGAGGLHVAFAMFLEFVPSKSRGMWSSIMQGWWTLGTLIQAVTALAVLPTLGWRALVLFSAVPVFFFFLTAFFLSESPRFLLSIGKVQQTVEVLESAAMMNGKQLPQGELLDMGFANIGIVPDMDSEDSDGYHSESDTDLPHIDTLEHWDFATSGVNPLRRSKLGYLKSMKLLLLGKYAFMTFTLLAIWVIAALVYYGLVLLTTALQVASNGGCDAEAPASIPLETSDYVEVIVTTIAELPGLLISALLVDRIGRKPLMALLFLFSGGSSFMLFIRNGIMRKLSLFVGRASVMGAFLVLYTYTPEVYGTSIRATAFGLCVSLSRIGGMVAPFVSQAPMDYGKPFVSFVILGTASIIGSLLVLILPVETAGMALTQFED